MSGIRYSHLTKEIEIEGSESFIESNFNKIQNLLGERVGAKKMIVSRKPKANREAISPARVKESGPRPEIARHEQSEVSQVSAATKSSFPEISPVGKASRPPLRKYIRKEGLPGQHKTIVEVDGQKPREISIASLKEKFGLSESKIGGIIRDAEKLGKLRRAMNGSYVWTED